MPRVFVITSTAYSWALRPFSYLFQTYWSTLQPVVVVGFEQPTSLPPNFQFFKCQTPDRDQNAWSTALIEFLVSVNDDHFILMLEDYWLTRTVDHRGIKSLCEYAQSNENILRIDLTCDVLHVAGDARDAPELGAYGHYDIVMKPFGSSYRMSLQAGLWNRKLLLRLLEQGKSSWQTELHIDPPEYMLVVGTRQWPVRYANAIYKGSIDWKEIERIPLEHREQIKSMIPQNWKAEGRG